MRRIMINTYNGVTIHPIKLNGKWELGYALDQHTLNSEYLGVDEHGHDRYEITRTAIGEMIYLIKYRDQHELIIQVADIASQAIRKLLLEDNEIDCIIPVPPSKEDRYNQPVIKIAELIASTLEVDFEAQMIDKSVETTQMKNTPVQLRKSKLKNVFHCNEKLKDYNNVLLFDDLFQSGATASGCADAIKAVKEDVNIFFISLTKTRS